MQTEKKLAQGELEDQLLLLLHIKEADGTTRQEAATVLDRSPEHTGPVVAAFDRLVRKSLAKWTGEGYTISDQGKVAVLGLLVQPSGFDRLREIRDKLPKSVEGRADNRSAGRSMKTPADPSFSSPESIASLAASVVTESRGISHATSDPVKTTLSDALAEAQTAKKLGACHHPRTIRKNGRIRCAVCDVEMPKIVDLK